METVPWLIICLVLTRVRVHSLHLHPLTPPTSGTIDTPSYPAQLDRKNTTNDTHFGIMNKGCLRCRGQSQPNQGSLAEVLDDLTIKQIRLELLKAKILSRLDLNEAPKGVRRPSDFPLLMTDGIVPEVFERNEPLSPRTENPQATSILVANSRFRCPSSIRSRSSCFRFLLENQHHPVISEKYEATLWLWKLADKGDIMPQMITVSQLRQENTEEDKQEVLISYLITNKTEGWISIDISWSAETSPSTFLDLRIDCPSCVGGRRNHHHHHPFASSPKHKPFLVLQRRSLREGILEKPRHKRSTRECPQDDQKCCRDSLYVDFSELGWDNWIIQPPGFNMYYCKGSCDDISVSSAPSNGNTYSALLQRLMLQPNITPSLREALAPCCSAGHKEPLSILWIEDPQTNAVRVSHLPDMIVTACDCYG